VSGTDDPGSWPGVIPQKTKMAKPVWKPRFSWVPGVAAIRHHPASGQFVSPSSWIVGRLALRRGHHEPQTAVWLVRLVVALVVSVQYFGSFFHFLLQ
jgi:hypothetical protein